MKKNGEFRFAHDIFEPGVQKSTVVRHDKKATPERVLLFLLSLSGVEVYPPSRGKSGHKLPKKQHPKGCCFFIELVRSRSLSPLAGEIRPQAPKSNSREGVAFLFETTNRCVMHETPISDHNRWYMHNYYGEISLQKGTSSPKRCLLSNVVAGCRTKMLVFDKLPLHLLSVCGIFDSVKAVRGVYMGNCVPLKLC